MTQPQGSKLRMDMTVPLWGIVVAALAVLGQAGAMVWGAAIVSEKVQTVSDRVTVIEGKLRESEKDHETLARVDQRTEDLVATVNRIDDRESRQEGRR